MNDHDRRRRFVPQADGLETRNLLSGVPTASRGMVEALRSLIPAITGTIHGTVTQVQVLSPHSQRIIYDAQGKANIIGDGKGSGQHVIVSKPLKGGGSTDTYKQGVATVKGTTDTVTVHYTGTGRTKPNGSFTATLKGTAKSVAGLNAGISGSFSARMSGPSRTTGTFTLTITIRVR